MVRSFRRPSDGEISAMRRMSARGFSTHEIAAMFSISSATVSYWLRKQGGRCEARSTPPRRNAAAVDLRRAHVLSLALRTTPAGLPESLSAMAIKRVLQREFGIEVSKQTVVSDLHKLQLTAAVRPKVCCLPQDHATRQAFAEQHRRMNPNRIVFTDEKIFTTNDEGSRTQWVAQGMRPSPRLKMRWPPGRVMVWAAIGNNFRHLVFLPNNVGREREHFRLTARAYVRRCLSSIVPFLQTSGRTLQQDGAACHTAGSTLRYLEEKGIRVLQSPPRSPDLNVIETLWAIMAPRVTKLAPTNRVQLEAAIATVWEELDTRTVNSLVGSFPKRCAEVIQKNGSM